MRFARRTDGNQAAIVAALRKIPGVTVAPGHDDILVGFRGLTHWYEIKAERAVSRRTGRVRAGEKQKSQKRLETEWRGHYKVVTGVEEILADLGLTK